MRPRYEHTHACNFSSHQFAGVKLILHRSTRTLTFVSLFVSCLCVFRLFLYRSAHAAEIDRLQHHRIADHSHQHDEWRLRQTRWTTQEEGVMKDNTPFRSDPVAPHVLLHFPATNVLHISTPCPPLLLPRSLPRSSICLDAECNFSSVFFGFRSLYLSLSLALSYQGNSVRRASAFLLLNFAIMQNAPRSILLFHVTA